MLRRHQHERAVRIDVDSVVHAPSRIDVLSIPTLRPVPGCTEIARLDGLIREADIEQALTAQTPPCTVQKTSG